MKGIKDPYYKITTGFLVMDKNENYLTEQGNWSTRFHKAQIYDSSKEPREYIRSSRRKGLSVKALIHKYKVQDEGMIQCEEIISNLDA